jgi:DNA-binding NarL/FixJ family response regulator
MKRILIADDHPIFRNGLKDILISKLTNTIIEDVENGAMAWDYVRKHKTDIAILDVDMPEMNGLEVCKQITANGMLTKVVILTMYKDMEIFNSAMDNGAEGFLLKDHSGSDLVDCIDAINAGKSYLGRGLEDRMISHSEYKDRKKQLKTHLQSLTSAELKTLKLVEKNLTSREIADKLFVTQKTIENYRSRICKKLRIPAGNNALIRWVMDNKDILKQI